MSRYDLHYPVCAFVIVFGVTKIAELLDWSRLHGDAVAMLGLRAGTVTALLLAGKGVELLLTAVAAIGLARRGGWPLAALAGWTADLALLSVVAGIRGDLGRLAEHGLCCLAFAVLLALTYARRPGAGGRPTDGEPRGPLSHTQEMALAALGRLRRSASDLSPSRRTRPLPDPRSGPEPEPPRPGPEPRPGPGRTPVPGVAGQGSAEPTRQDLPVRRSSVTRQDLPVHRSDVTRQDLPVRGRRVAPPDPLPDSQPDDDATRPGPGR
jgi:hypothetical protein